MTRTTLILVAALVALPLAATAAEHRRGRETPRMRELIGPRHRAVGLAVPIVAGSSSVKVDAVGQVVTDFNVGQLSDSGRASGNAN